jgi:hypothetical protein
LLLRLLLLLPLHVLLHQVLQHFLIALRLYRQRQHAEPADHHRSFHFVRLCNEALKINILWFLHGGRALCKSHNCLFWKASSSFC